MNWGPMAIGGAIGAVCVFAIWRDAWLTFVAGLVFAGIAGDLWPLRWEKRR